MNDAQPDLPMTEAQWERFMQKADARSAKFGELLETLKDHPDRDALIDHEMGWDRDDSEADDGCDGPAFELPDVETINREIEAEMEDDDWKEEARRQDEALHAIAAYTRGFEWGLSVHKTLQPYLKAADDAGVDYDPDEPLVVAFGDSLVVAAKIAGGHGMGYDDDSLCGNIVNCKKSLRAADNALAALKTLRDEGMVPGETLRPLMEEGREVRRLVAEWIAELRVGVWWE